MTPSSAGMGQRPLRQRSRALAALLRAVPGLAVAAVLLGLGHPVPAWILAALMAGLITVGYARPGWGRRVDAAVATFGRAAGNAIAFVGMLVVHVLVFVPLAAGMRLLRRDPLRLRPVGAGDSMWVVRAPQPDSLARRQYALEPDRVSTTRRSGWRRAVAAVAGAVAFLVVALAANYGIGRVWELAFSSDPPDPRASLPALADAAWAEEFFEERDAIGMRWEPLLGLRQEDFDGQHVHVADGIRRSYQAAVPGKPVRVFFFGGSTMWGVAQRDLHTIPSELARLAEADGLPLEVVNYGDVGWVLWQELALLQRIVTSGDVPHIAVFYDGVNEANAQVTDQSPEPTFGRAAAIRDLLEPETTTSILGAAWDDYVEHSVVHKLARWIRPPRDPERRIPTDRALERRVVNAEDIYRRGVDLGSRLAESFGFDALFFFQPALGTRDPVESDVVETLRPGLVTRSNVHRLLAERVPDGVIDLSDSLDGVEGPLFIDWAHTNERAAQLVAAEIYGHILPLLVEHAAVSP